MVGNDAVLRCNVPSFVADFVAVLNWVDGEGREFYANKNGNHEISNYVRM